ncbi:MAG TPA: hypothetical protein DCS09_13925 [Porphyromonadaceae bacterium]|nr:hypothetical protein [Porphyromonadaceae bacterium]
MDFLPLAIWSVGYFYVASYGERTYFENGMSEEKVRAKTGLCKYVWAAGIVAFLALGIWQK